MRLVMAALLWLLTTAVLAVAVAASWAHTNLVAVDGYAALARSAAADTELQHAVASELTTQIANLGTDVPQTQVLVAARIYTASAAFPEQFAQANGFAHRWLFTDRVASAADAQGRWVVDVAPMLADRSFTDTLRRYGIKVPDTLSVPLTERAPEALRPGQLHTVATWAPWASWAAVALTAILALLTLAAGRSKPKTLAALGVSALLLGAAGWGGLEVGRRHLDNRLDGAADLSTDIRDIVEAMVGQAIDSLHHWLNIILLAGGALVVLGVIGALLAGLFRRADRT